MLAPKMEGEGISVALSRRTGDRPTATRTRHRPTPPQRHRRYVCIAARETRDAAQAAGRSPSRTVTRQ